MDHIDKHFIRENIFAEFENTKLIHLQGIGKFYEACRLYLKSLSGKQLYTLREEIEKQIILIPQNTQKVKLINLVLDFISQQSNKDTYERLKINIKQRKPKNKKAKHPCFNSYKVISKIGNGAFGDVWLVKKGKRRYALKVQSINMNNVYDLQKVYKNLENEMLQSELLGKHGIGPKIYDYYICSNSNTFHVILVMEYMNYGTLEAYLNVHSLTDSDRSQILSKIKKMHKLGIIHGDIHEGNIFVKKKKGKFTFYLGDFGFSKSFKQLKSDTRESDLDALELVIDNKYRSNEIIAKLMVLVNVV